MDENPYDFVIVPKCKVLDQRNGNCFYNNKINSGIVLKLKNLDARKSTNENIQFLLDFYYKNKEKTV